MKHPDKDIQRKLDKIEDNRREKINWDEVNKVKVGSKVLVQPNRNYGSESWRRKYVNPPKEVTVTSMSGVGNAFFWSGITLYSKSCVVKVVQ